MVVNHASTVMGNQFAMEKLALRMEFEGLCSHVGLGIQVENTVRWRYARDEQGDVMYDELGNQLKESNARVVRWSDGR